MIAIPLGWKIAMAALGALGLVYVVKRAKAEGPHTRARDMSIDQALAEMRQLAAAGLVEIRSEGDGGDQPRMIVGPVIAGVSHVYLDSKGETARSQIDNLDPRFGVYLVRLDQLLAKMGVDTLLDLGITHGGSNLQDVHNQGRAIDLAGVRGPSIDLSVLHDWGEMPNMGSGYRLVEGDPGFALFRALYEFGVLEGSDRSCDSKPRPEGPPSDIGFGSCLITPDHPSPALHRTHQNHMHMQVGRTFGVEP